MGPTNNDKVLAKAESISIPTEPIGNIPRPIDLIEEQTESADEDPNLAPLCEAAIRETLSGLKRVTPLNGGLGVTIEFAPLVEIARAT